MKKLNSTGIAITLALVGVAVSAPAVAQKKGKDAAAAQPAAWAPKLSKQEAAALQPVEAAVKAQNWAAATAALAAAQPAVTSADGRYFLGQYQFSIGSGTNNAALQGQGVDAMIASGGGDPTRTALLYKTQGGLALNAKDFAKAEAAFGRLAQLSPNDVDTQMALAEIKFRQKKPQEALPLLQRAIAARQAAGQPVPEQWHLLALQSAIDAKSPEATALSRNLVASSPTPRNWRNALLIFRQNANLDDEARLDTFRLMRATNALDTSDEYLSLADRLARGRFYVEVEDVLNQGAASGKLPRTNAGAAALMKEVSGKAAGDRTALAQLEPRARSGTNGELALRLAEGYFGHKDFAKAADFYRLALQKGGVDANLVNTRLGISLAQAGRRAEAEAAFKAVTGPRADLVSLWMLWLSKRA